MEPEEYEIMYRVEATHWWYLGMQSITMALLRQRYGPGANLRILDAGCGTGSAMTTYLTEFGTVTGFDLSKLALEYCRRRHAERLACASSVHLPFAPGSFDLVTSFDVLYEAGVLSDAQAVAEMFRVLRPAGRLLLRLPAYEWLRGRHDKVVHTARRYSAGMVAGLLCNAGFHIERLSYANMFLFPLALVKRLLEPILPIGSDSDLELKVGILNGLLARVMSAEAPLVARGRLPFGLSVVAVGRRPEA